MYRILAYSKLSRTRDPSDEEGSWKLQNPARTSHSIWPFNLAPTCQSFTFVPAKKLTRSAFEQAPVWMEWEEPEQDIEITSWGVDVAAA